MAVHTPVLVDMALHFLCPMDQDALLCDATLGEGGHSYAFLSHSSALRVIGIDADAEILAVAQERLKEFADRIEYYHGWSQDFFASYPEDKEKPDSILIDLGISLYHYEVSSRGFSFSRDEYLDMRIDPTRGVSAAELLRRISEADLADMLYRNAEERNSRRIAHAIVAARREGAIESSAALAHIVASAVPGNYGPIHPATKTFLALRIAVNRELEQLEALLGSACSILKMGGRLGVLSFHSLEDRVVKLFFRAKAAVRASTGSGEKPKMNGSGTPCFRILTRKPIGPDEAEIRKNPPSRSAKLRVIEKLAEEGRL